MLVGQCLYRVSSDFPTTPNIGPMLDCQRAYGPLTLSYIWWSTGGFKAFATVGPGYPVDGTKSAAIVVAYRRYNDSSYYQASGSLLTVLWWHPPEVRRITSGQISGWLANGPLDAPPMGHHWTGKGLLSGMVSCFFFPLNVLTMSHNFLCLFFFSNVISNFP